MARINTHLEARNLDDLHGTLWRIVARQPIGHGWRWLLPKKDVAKFQARRDRLEIATVQRRDMDQHVLLAKISTAYRG